VPRASFRNFLKAFRILSVDDSARGPEVSDGVQLTYLADDLRETGYGYVGAGAQEAAVVGQHGILSLECRTPRGLIVDVVSCNNLVGFGTDQPIFFWSLNIPPTIVGPSSFASPMRGGFEAPAQETLITTGTILTANLAVGRMRYLAMGGAQWKPFHVPLGNHFNMAFSVANIAVDMGLMWRTLRLF